MTKGARSPALIRTYEAKVIFKIYIQRADVMSRKNSRKLLYDIRNLMRLRHYSIHTASPFRD
jgi:hypothetical protein